VYIWGSTGPGAVHKSHLSQYGHLITVYGVYGFSRFSKWWSKCVQRNGLSISYALQAARISRIDNRLRTSTCEKPIIIKAIYIDKHFKAHHHFSVPTTLRCTRRPHKVVLSLPSRQLLTPTSVECCSILAISRRHPTIPSHHLTSLTPVSAK
jgi:hypothetical protein